MKITLLLTGLGMAGLQSCVITNTPGFYSGYKKLPAAEQGKIRFVPAGQPIPAANGRLIYAVGAQSLLKAIQHNDTTLVYIWGPHCHSSDCASLQSVEDVCRKKGYQFQAVAEYYADMEQINLQAPLQSPLLAINHQHYKSDYCQKYTKLFEAELRQGQPLPDSTSDFRYYLFKGDKFVRVLRAVKEAQPQFSQLPSLGTRNR